MACNGLLGFVMKNPVIASVPFVAVSEAMAAYRHQLTPATPFPKLKLCHCFYRNHLK